MIKFTIVTTAFNSAKTIEDTLLSIYSQSYQNFEHIVIDNNSEDGTHEIVKKYKKSILISDKDNGIYYAMNTALSLAKGEFVFFLNSDDWLYSNDVLEKISKKLTHNIDCSFGNILITNNYYPFKIFRVWSQTEAPHSKKNFSALSIPHPSFILRTSIARKIGLFDTRFKISADFDYISKTLKVVDPKKIVYLDFFISVMRRGGISSRNIFSIIYSNYELLIFGNYRLSVILLKVFKKIMQIKFNVNSVYPPSFLFLKRKRVDLSISIVYFNTNHDVFLNTIKSILNSKKLSISLYIINNSKKTLPKEILSNKKIQVLNVNKNLGFGVGHNLVLLNRVNSRFHLCLNPDVSFGPNLLSNLILNFNSRKMGFLIPAVKYLNRRHHPSFRNFPGLYDLFINKFFSPIFLKHPSGCYAVKCVSGCFLLTKTDLFKRLKGFDPRFFIYMEDIDISRRMDEIKDNYYISRFNIMHKFERGSSSSLKLFLFHFVSVLKYLIKWHSRSF